LWGAFLLFTPNSENFAKASKFTFKLFWEKEIQKKGAGAAGPTASLSARSRARPSFSPSTPRADAPTLLHPTLATWRPYVGDVAEAALLRPA